MTIFRRLASLPQLLIALAVLPWLPRSLRPQAGPPALHSSSPAAFPRPVRLALLALALAAVLLWSGPAQAQTPTVLVKNTGQTASTITLAPDTTNPRDAQAFTTGSHVYGYTLSSIGISFDAIAAPTTAGSELTVTLNEPGSDGNPGSLLCTLSDPATFTASMVNAFDAPTTGTQCPRLDPDTTYFVVVERANNNTDAISYQTTLSNDEDSGGADGWSIGHATYYYQSSDSTWGSTPSQSMLIEVNGSAGLPPLLVSNTGETSFTPGLGLQTSTPMLGQAFTTGSEDAGYVLGSIGFKLKNIANTGTAGAQLQVTLNEVDSDNHPGTALCTLTDPTAFSGSGVQTFHATTTNSCPTLTASTTYFAVIERVAFPTPNTDVSMNFTGSIVEHSDSATGWSIGDDNRFISSGTWTLGSAGPLQIEVRGEVANASPEFSAETATRTLPENSGAGVDVVGGTITATDGDSDTLTYSLTGTDAASFEIDSNGQLKTKTGTTHDFNFEATKNSYSVTVNVTDGKDDAGDADTAIDDTIDVTIDLTNLDEAGTVTLPATLTGGTAVTASLSDPDGTVSGDSWQWARGDTATGSFSDISGATAASYTPVAADVGKYLRANVTYTDPEGSGKTASATSSSAVDASNSDPEFSAETATRTLPENSAAGVNVVGGVIAATDGDADTLTYTLTGTDAASFEIDSNGQLKTKTGDTHDFNLEATKNSYSVTVNVSDSKDIAGDADTVIDDSIAVTIDLTNVNEAPEITTSATTANVAENTTAVLTLAASDVDASDTQTWSVESGGDGSKFNISSSGALTFKDAPNFEIPTDADTMNDYVVTVKVADGGGLSDTHTITVTVTDANDAPVITSPPATKSVPENSTAVHTFAATDVDSLDTLSWSVEPADDGSKFEIDGTTGALSFANAPDFETPTDMAMNNTYVVTVKVEDNGSPRMSATHTVTVTVTNLNEAPVITTVSPTHTAFDVDENTATSEVIKTYEATDVDADTTLTWTLEGTDAGDFTITKNADGHGELKFSSVPNFEMPVDNDTMNDFDITVKVRDNGIPGNRVSSNQLDATVSVVVNVLDVNETPVVSGDSTPDFPEIEYDATSPVLTIGTYTATDDEGDSVTWAVSGTDATHFSVDATTGVLSFSIRPDFENPVDLADSDSLGASNNQYEIVLEAEDDNAQGGKTGTKTGTFNVAVTVTNVDETPEITTTNASHTAPSFMEIEYDATTAELEVADYDGRDEEGQTITWSRTGTDAGDFTIDTNTGILSFVQRPNFEMPADDDGDNAYNVTVRASDTASPANVRELPVVVSVTDVNERPDIDEDTVSSYVEIEYNFTGTRPDVHTFTATDYDDMDTIAWSLLGTDAAHLEIGATTGILTFTQDAGFGQGPLPNFEHPRDDDVGDGSSNTYNVTVRATDDDANPKFSDYAVVVTVTNVNEQPEFTGTPETALTPDENDFNTDYVVVDLADYDARDEEGTVTWSLTGADSGDFTISADGVVTFAGTPNYEAPEDSGGDNVYEFNVVATDVASGSTRRSVSQAVTVTVMDVEEVGTVTLDNLNPEVGQTLTFRLTDPDGGIDLTLDSNMDPQIMWRVESMATGESWVTVGGVFSPNSTTFAEYSVDEDETGKALRGVVTYIDRRGPGKTAMSEATAAVTADPVANAAPRFRGGSTWSVEEGPAGKDVGSPISATDRDNDTLTYGIQAGQDAASFEINPSTGQVRTAEELDFETTSGRLQVTITLHDGKDSDGNADTTIDDTRTATVQVTDVEEDGVVTLSTEEAETGTPLTATIEDGDGSVTGEVWQWARSANGQTGWTNISGATSSEYTPTVSDEDSFLRATVTYTDRRGAGKSAEAITGRRVPSENRSPMFPATEDGQRTVPENTRAGQSIGEPVAAEDPENNNLTYALTGTDAGAFTIAQSTGQIRVKDALDFETKPSYSVTVEVHDGRDGMGNPSADIDDTQAVTITVQNVEEPGVVTLTTDTGTIQARAEVTATLEDDDGVAGSVGWQWARSPNGRTDWVNIAGATSAAYTPTLEEDRGNYIRATASYDDGHGQNKTANAVSPRVGDPPPVNSQPVFPSTENGQREVAEDAVGGANIGDPVEATDLNAGDSNVNDPLAYSLTGTAAASFTIDAGTGQISLAQGATLDYEGKRTHRFTVQVTDGRDQHGDDDLDAVDDTITVTITVTDVNEAPMVTGDATVSYQEESNSAVATYTAADPDQGDTVTWSVSNDTEFWISEQGKLYFRSPPSFEVQTTYQVTVTATDDDTTPLSGTLVVDVTVTDAEEEGTVVITPPRGWVDVLTQFTADLTDDDGGINDEAWQWARSSNRSSWEDISGATFSIYTVTDDDANQYLRAAASYEDRRGSNKEASAAQASPVGEARPAMNTAPEFTQTDPVTRTVREGTAAGRNVGSPVRANDANQGDVLTYSLLSGTDADAFDIDPVTGQIRTKALLDREVKDTYVVTVSVHDGFDTAYISSDASDDTIEVTITVTAAPVTVRPPPITPAPPPLPPLPDRCIAEDIGTLAETVTQSGNWADDCESEVSGRGYARYYSFTLTEPAEVTIDLSSTVDTYLYLREGNSTSGATIHENDDIGSGNTNSQIQETLSAGTYTVEATTSSAGATGAFILTITVEDVLSVAVSRAAGSEDVKVRPGSPISLMATFSRPVSGFAIEDIIVENGAVGNFAGSGAVYTFDVTPDAIGVVAVEISAGAAEDGDGNGNKASPRFSVGITYDDDGNGDISRAEVISAIIDYFDGRISRSQAIAVIGLYFA